MKLYEISTIGSGRSNVDRDAGVIRSVKILGRESKNGRLYSDKALSEAARQYEGCDVNINHPDKSKPHSERKIEDGIGWLESVEVRQDGVYGDLHYLKEHPTAGILVEAAERRSNRFGLSHNAQGTVKKVNGKNVVESIDRVLSVDLVQTPATNEGLFESQQVTVREVLEQHAPDLLQTLLEDAALLPPEVMDEPAMPMASEGDGAAETVKAACAQILTAMLDLPGNVASLCTNLIAVCQKVIAGQPEPEADPANPEGDPNNPEAPEGEPGKEKPNDPAADPTAADEPSAEESDPANPFEKRKKPMAEATVPEKVRQELDELREENRQLKEQIAHATLREQCDALLRSNFRESTPARITALANMPDDEARTQLIEEWPSNKPEDPRPKKPNFCSPPVQRVDSAYPSDMKSFVEACR